MFREYVEAAWFLRLNAALIEYLGAAFAPHWVFALDVNFAAAFFTVFKPWIRPDVPQALVPLGSDLATNR